jgi:DNA primase catalytic subunit
MNTDLITDTDRLSQCIGKVVIDFQFIEYTLSEILARLLELKETNDIYRILAAMNYRQKVDFISDIYELRKPNNWPNVDISLSRKALFAAEDFRNKVVHSFWHINNSTWFHTKSSLKTSKGLKIDTGRVNIEYLEKSLESLHIIRDWYLGRTDKLINATKELKEFAEQLHINEKLYKKSKG